MSKSTVINLITPPPPKSGKPFQNLVWGGGRYPIQRVICLGSTLGATVVQEESSQFNSSFKCLQHYALATNFGGRSLYGSHFYIRYCSPCGGHILRTVNSRWFVTVIGCAVYLFVAIPSFPRCGRISFCHWPVRRTTGQDRTRERTISSQ